MKSGWLSRRGRREYARPALWSPAPCQFAGRADPTLPGPGVRRSNSFRYAGRPFESRRANRRCRGIDRGRQALTAAIAGRIAKLSERGDRLAFRIEQKKAAILY